MSKTAPYVLVVFTSRKSNDLEGYYEMDARLLEKLQSMPGFLGSESFSNEIGLDVTIARFRTEEDLLSWKSDDEHRFAQNKGQDQWYEYYKVEVCSVYREYEYIKEE